MKISVSDMRTFNRCRRKWDLVSPNRQNLQRAIDVKDFFVVGHAYHEALDLLKTDPDIDVDQAVDVALITSTADARTNYLETVGAPMSDEEVMYYFGHVDTDVREMVHRYIRKYGRQMLPEGFKYLHSELTGSVPIANQIINGVWDYVKFIFTVDGLCVEEDTGELWVVEHKTYSRPPSVSYMEFDDQFRCYAYGVEELTGKNVAGVLYDGISKKAPTEPRLLKDGTLSKAAINTDVHTFMNAITKHGLNPADYAGRLAEIRLLNDEEDPFFKREFIRYNQYSIEESMSTMWATVHQMGDAMRRPELELYPHRPYNGCSDCNVRTLCDAMTNQEDIDYIRTNYVAGPVYGTFAKEPITKLVIDV